MTNRSLLPNLLVDLLIAAVMMTTLVVGPFHLGIGLGLTALQIGVTGHVFSIGVPTPGYQLFLAADTAAALTDVSEDRRGTVSGLLGLSRNIGLIAGASAMEAVFALAVGTEEFARASASAIAHGMRLIFLLAGGMMIVAIGVAFGHLDSTRRSR